ncbi:MAG: RnfABCDGE type electron transport complex subunit D [Spirochaetaceae bacterium]|jgi:electron transport complex protein RnfD|nr:RnfABCDGE type electron transport complex subunit D [Spirochaetaceae bacterium]
MELFYKSQISLARSTEGQMWLISFCVFLAVIQSALTDSFSSLIIAVSAVSVAALTEFFIYFRTDRAGIVHDGSSVLSPLILTLLLPNHLNPVYAAVGAFFAMAVVKHSFGGPGSNWLNPAVGAWLFIRFSWPDAFNKALELASIPQESAPASALAERIADFLNQTIFPFIGTSIPSWYIDLFNAQQAGIIADRGIAALLVGTIIMSAFGTSRIWIPVVYLAVYCLLIRVFGAFFNGGLLGQGDMMQGLFSGATLVAAFLLIADPATKAKSSVGVLVTTILAAILAFIFRYCAGDLYGAVSSVALINIVSLAVRDIENKSLHESISLLKSYDDH